MQASIWRRCSAVQTGLVDEDGCRATAGGMAKESKVRTQPNSNRRNIGIPFQNERAINSFMISLEPP